jgi:hypothetical protein
MPHPLVTQLKFTRSELKRGLAGITDEEARRRFLPMNSISWIIAHLAWQEQRYWLTRAQGQVLIPELNTDFAFGAPASTPPLDQAWSMWTTVTAAAEPWLAAVTTQRLTEPVMSQGKPLNTNWGTLMLRMIYHYWFHLGECLAIRQSLGHADLPQFVGNLDAEAPYRVDDRG